MDVSTPKSVRRNTRLRVEIPITVTSIDRKYPFLADCLALVVSPQGCGFRAEKSLPLETPVLISALPGGGTASGRVANCLPLGNGGKYFLVGVSLFNPGNVWGIADPPQDWNCAAKSAAGSNPVVPGNGKNVWPYNRFSNRGEAHRGRK